VLVSLANWELPKTKSSVAISPEALLVTFETVERAPPAVAQETFPAPSVVIIWFAVPSWAGKVYEAPVPWLSPSIVKEPFNVVLPFFNITRASLFADPLVPFPITNKRSVFTQPEGSGDPACTVFHCPTVNCAKDSEVKRIPAAVAPLPATVLLSPKTEAEYPVTIFDIPAANE